MLAERLVKQHVSILTADPGKPFNWVNEHLVILHTESYLPMLISCFVAMNAIIDSEQSESNITSVKTQSYSVKMSVEKLTGNFEEHGGEWKLTASLPAFPNEKSRSETNKGVIWGEIIQILQTKKE